MVGLEAQINFLTRRQLLEVVDLNANLVGADLDTAFQETAQVDRIDHAAFHDVAVGAAVGGFQMQRNIFRPQIEEDLITRLRPFGTHRLDMHRR